MRIDMPLCDFNNCRHEQDGNCAAKGAEREGCEYRILLAKDLKRDVSIGTHEEWFVSQCKGMTPLEILNWYRNFYHANSTNTEGRVVADAIDKIFMEYKDAFR